jgi:hypothetical protein
LDEGTRKNAEFDIRNAELEKHPTSPSEVAAYGTSGGR